MDVVLVPEHRKLSQDVDVDRTELPAGPEFLCYVIGSSRGIYR